MVQVGSNDPESQGGSGAAAADLLSAERAAAADLFSAEVKVCTWNDLLSSPTDSCFSQSNEPNYICLGFCCLWWEPCSTVPFATMWCPLFYMRCVSGWLPLCWLCCNWFNFAVARNCPELRSLDVTDQYKITDSGLKAVARGCPQLRLLAYCKL